MRIITRTLEVETGEPHDYVDVTEKIKEEIDDAGIEKGIVNIFCKHTTSAVVIQEKNEEVHKDTEDVLKKMLPQKKEYKHTSEGKINAKAHIKNQLIGPSITVPIREEEMALGVWQRIFFLELFEPKKRKLEITIMGSPAAE